MLALASLQKVRGYDHPLARPTKTTATDIKLRSSGQAWYPVSEDDVQGGRPQETVKNGGRSVPQPAVRGAARARVILLAMPPHVAAFPAHVHRLGQVVLPGMFSFPVLVVYVLVTSRILPVPPAI